MEKQWIFPFEEVEKGSKIIIYGAGDVGTCFYSQIKATGYCDLLAWVDSNYKDINNSEVQDPKIVSAMAFDYVIVAILSRRAINQVVEYLKSLGIAQNRIWTNKINEKQYNQCKVERVYLNDFPNMNIDLNCMRIAYIVPNPIKGGGGHRNIFRAVKYLSDKGHDLSVYYTNSEYNAAEMKKLVSEWFYDMSKVEFIKYEGKMDYYDVGIATWWETAYILEEFKSHFRRHMYFVQDYEPYFYPLSSEYFLAENTYKKGYLHICSGPWCETLLKKKYGAKAESFQFPIDRRIYNTERMRVKQNKNIVFFAKPEMSRRCYKIGIDALKIFHDKRPEVEIILYGSSQLDEQSVPFKATVLKLLPTINDLAELYINADLGIVFSPTNPSLVPYEMMACGCPVVDLDVEFAQEKYGGSENLAFLVDPDSTLFAKKLIEIIDNDSLLDKKRKAAKEWVDKEFPDEEGMGNRVLDIIKKGI